MSTGWRVERADLERVARVAQLLALKVRPGDLILLEGDLGAGKTTLARALIRALLADERADIPSPTFPIVQTYAAPRLAVAHFDFYRLSGRAELDEIGFDDAVDGGLAIVEWPQRALDVRPSDRLEIAIAATPDAPDLRDLTLVGHGAFAERLARIEAIDAFLEEGSGRLRGWQIAYLQGDASQRAYARLTECGRSMVLMDAPALADGPPLRNGRPYSRIAHLAEDVRPFVAIGKALAAAGLSVPRIVAADLDAGLLLLEDFGDLTFGRALQQGFPQDQLWLAAVDVLAALRANPPALDLPLPDASRYRLPRFDRAALEIEIELILDWYWPAVKGAPVGDALRAEFMHLWAPVLDSMLRRPAGFFARDYHSPNLFWLPHRTGHNRVGVIDFQDALAEHWSYDVVSLLQDARVDVGAELEAAGLARYCATVAAAEPAFDEREFRAAYAAFGLQRNTRLVGLWVRLLRRDGKPQYLQHMPRTWDYIARNLRHPDLAALAAWYDRHFPVEIRQMPIVPG